MFSRREILYLAAATALGAGKMTSKERVDRALKGQDVDRTPFTFWHHFGLEKYPGEPFPKPAGNWYDLKVVSSPFPEQLRALEIIREGLHGQTYFLETLFNPWNVAEKMSSKEDVLKLKEQNPKALEAALETIAESEASHAKRAIAAGAAGIFFAIANAQEGIMTPEDYGRFSEPFDRLV